MEDVNFTYQYDNNGNRTTKTVKVGGAITQYEYDAENKLVRVVSPNNTANYKYDGLRRRVEKEVIAGTTTTTRYVYDNEDILLELDGSNNILARYTHGPGIDEPLIMEKNAESFYYHADGLGSITELTNQSGTVTHRYTYSSFGKIESQLDSSFVQPYTFTSREFDPETGLYHYRARTYDASSGRFLQEDPLGFSAGMNFFSMVSNNPLIKIDPFGLTACEDFVKSLLKDFNEANNSEDLGDQLLEKRSKRLADVNGFRNELVSGGQGGSVSQHIYGHAGAVVKYGGLGYVVSLLNQGIDYLQRYQRGRTREESEAEIADDRAAREVAMELLKAFPKKPDVGAQVGRWKIGFVKFCVIEVHVGTE